MTETGAAEMSKSAGSKTESDTAITITRGRDKVQISKTAAALILSAVVGVGGGAGMERGWGLFGAATETEQLDRVAAAVVDYSREERRREMACLMSWLQLEIRRSHAGEMSGEIPDCVTKAAPAAPKVR